MAVQICPVCGNKTDQWGYCFHHCHYCFKSLGEHEICDCGFEMRKRPPGTLPEGTILENGKYIIGGVLGKGGFGITYLGFHTVLKSRIAIKEYFPSDFVTRGSKTDRKNVVSRSPYYDNFLEKFKNEAVILEQFNNLSNIVQVKDLVLENNTAYIIMEYIQGVSLKDLLIEKGGKMNWKELLPLLAPITRVLDKIHQKNIIHRDISPDNIIIDEQGQPVLLDFGTARIGQKNGVTIAAGKYGYAPIEQLTGSEEQDRRTDIYALGATYYKALTGKTPNNAKTRIGEDELAPVNVLEPDVPGAVSDAIMKALAVNINDRWNNAAEFLNALEGTDSIPEKETKPEKTKKRFNPIIPAAIFAVLLAVLFYFYSGFHYPEAVRDSFQKARSGDPAAQVFLGDYWASGEGGKEDSKRAVLWYWLAAEQGNDDAEYSLALCYREGKGVEKDIEAYRHWLERAARQENAAAQFDFGQYFELGYEGKPNLSRAKYWYEKAAENGSKDASKRLSGWK